MKIGITGTHGTGKTTLAGRLADELKIPLIKERARTVAKRWGLTPATIPEKNKYEFQWEVLFEQIQQEEAHKSGFVSDRTVYDNLAYYRAIWWHDSASNFYDWFNYQPEEVSLSHWNTFAWSRYEKLVQENGKYDLVLVLKPEWDLVDDGERHVEKSFQTSIELEIDTILNQYAKSQCEVVFLTGSSTDERLEKALKLIKEKTK